MSQNKPASLPKLPDSLQAEHRGEILLIRLSRPQKRNALNDETVLGLETLFDAATKDVKAVVIHGEGEHFSAGLDLSELRQHNIEDAIRHSRSWHSIFNKIEFGSVPVVAALHGAVVGGGLELAATAHVRIAERSTFYAFPEGVRGIFVGGGGSVRIPRLIGASRMMEMMLTGHVLSAEEGQALGLSHYLVDAGAALEKAIDLANKIAANAWLTNFGIIQALPRIADQDPASGYVMEALMAAIAGGGEEAKARVKAFLEKRAPKVSATEDR
jgi:enoyl-CoA hydratase/carnithine racemase